MPSASAAAAATGSETMKSNFRRLLGALLLGIAAAGCRNLPEGDAPDGAIVGSQMRSKPLSPRAAEDRLLTSLTLFTLNELPGARIRIDAPAVRRPMLERVLHSLQPLSGVRAAGSDSPYLLRFTEKNSEWN